MGSVRCARHNTKLVKKIVLKKMSCVDKHGVVSWKMGEVTILACPGVSICTKDSTYMKRQTFHHQIMRIKRISISIVNSPC